MVRTNYPCAHKSCSSHQSTLSTVRERKLLNSCSATTVRLSCPKILSCTKAAANYATKYLLVCFFNQRAWDGVWFVLKVCSCLHVQIYFKIRIPYQSIMLYSFLIDDNCRFHFWARVESHWCPGGPGLALFETADLDDFAWMTRGLPINIL